MRYRRTIRPVSVLFVLALLISYGTVVALSGTPVTGSTADSPIRLRLRAAKSTLRSGEATSVWIEFLDRDYQKVQSDGSRAVVFGIATRRRNAGVIAEREIVVKRGDWSAGTMFTAGEAGSVVVTCQSEGLDSDDTTLVVTPPAASWLSQIIGMFETTAHADRPTEFRFDSTEKKTSAREDGRLDFQLIWAPPPASDTTVQISTNPPSRIDYQGRSWYGVADITLGPQNGASSDISIISSEEGRITVTAKAASHFTQATAIANFTKPVADRIRFKDDPKEIPPGENVIAVTLEVTDKAGFPVKSGEPRTFSFEKGSDIVPVEFKPPSVTLPADRSAVEILVHLKDLKDLPTSGEIRVGATSSGLESGWKRIAVRGQVKSLKLQGNRTVQLGKVGAYFDVQLLDRYGNLVSTDKDRTINLMATDGGTISPVTIPKGQSVARVHYVPSGSASSADIHVNSEGLVGESVRVQLVIALYWLVIVALIGGLVGGVIRHISKSGYKVPRILPCWTGDCWDLGLVGKLAVSVVGGLILYLLVKFGLYQILASLTLPEALDSGTKLVAFFFGVIGGFAGIYLFDWVLSKLLPGGQPQPAPAA